jgi:ribonuclease VapC
MIVDTSALIAVLMNEEDEDTFARAMLKAESLKMTAATWLEAAIIIDQRPHPGDGYAFEDDVKYLKIQMVPVTVEIAYLAKVAYNRFGKGQHSARLNCGDCFSYALAKHTSEPLLFKGNDFAQTDIRSALTT